jgi:hypothetical protein
MHTILKIGLKTHLDFGESVTIENTDNSTIFILTTIVIKLNSIYEIFDKCSSIIPLIESHISFF